MNPAAAIVAALVEPDRDEAREWAERELSDRAYDEARPTLLDVLARAVLDFFTELLSGEPASGWGLGLAITVKAIVLGLLIGALVVWGRPRRLTRLRETAGDLFGHDDGKSAGKLRQEAEAAAARARWEDAVVLRVRATARALAERGVVELPPGATVHAFAARVARAFPGEQPRADAVADAFDAVRYLRRPGSAALYRAAADLDDRLSRSQPLPAEAEA